LVTNCVDRVKNHKKSHPWVAFLFQRLADYLLAASEAGAAGAAASEAGAEAASTGAGAAGAAAGASFLPQATRAAAAKRVANRSDFFMSIFLIGDENNFRKLPQLSLRPS
jgi:hypothetical protein